MDGRGSVASREAPLGPPPLYGDHRITVWRPGVEISFEKPLSYAFFLRLPLSLAVLFGPALWIAMGRQLRKPDLVAQAVLSAVVGLVGLWLGLSNFKAAMRALPERITFHWPSKRLLRVSRFRGSFEVPLDAVTAIEVKGVREVRLSGDGDVRHETPTYKCVLLAHCAASATAAAGTITLAETEFVDKDHAAPMRQASTVAGELASALGVEHRVTDYRW
jgi:hypothetical protein